MKSRTHYAMTALKVAIVGLQDDKPIGNILAGMQVVFEVHAADVRSDMGSTTPAKVMPAVKPIATDDDPPACWGGKAGEGVGT